jgi:seryl-tRNA synthetase
MKQPPRPSGTPQEGNSSKPDPKVLEEAKGIKENIQMLEPEFERVEGEFLALYKKIPNIPTADTPVGLTEEENVMVKKWGQIREFDFPVRNHSEIAEIR